MTSPAIIKPPDTRALRGRSLLKEMDFTKEEFLSIVDLANELRHEKRTGTERRRMVGRNIALIFEKASTRTRCAFEVGAHDQGAHVTYLGPDGSHIGVGETIKDTARVLGRMFDGIEYRGFAQESVEILAKYSGVPVWNGLTDQWHPTQMLADIMTMRDHTAKRLEDVIYCYLGDARNNTGNSLLVQTIASKLAVESGARLHIVDDVGVGVEGADFLYTDVWVSMGEPVSDWKQRIDQLRAYQVNAATMKATGNPNVKFMHCLPALHNIDTELGKQIFTEFQLDALEVTEEVFESPASIVFDEAENRLHTIKAAMVAAIGD